MTSSMSSLPLSEAATELRHQFTNLLESLSAVRSLLEVDPRVGNEEELLDQALTCLAEHQALERSSVFLLEEDHLVNRTGLARSEFMPGTSERFPSPEGRKGATYPASEGLMGRALATGELQHAEECLRDDRFRAWDSDSESLTGSLICAPIQQAGENLGIINVSHPAPHAFETWHEHLLKVFSAILGFMLVNHRLVNRMEELVKDRTGRLEEALRETETLKEKFEQLSVIDDLTELHNRRFFFPEASAAVYRAIRYETPLTLLTIDLDLFKEVNDRYGHAAGDRVLVDIANHFREMVREGDILARMGGEEFVIALPHTGLDGGITLAERIRSNIQELGWTSDEGVPFGITASVGVTALRATGLDQSSQRVLDRLMAEADKAVYFCKANGRNQVVAYPNMASEI